MRTSALNAPATWVAIATLGWTTTALPAGADPVDVKAGDTRTAEVYSQLSARPSPTWLQEGVIYEVFPRVFSQRGDLYGVTQQLDRLQTLGVNILYLMPLHPQGKVGSKGSLGSPYAVRDYYAINPDYGTAADLERLVVEAHQRGLKVILDVVANHTSWDSVLMKHPEFYVHDSAGHILPPRPEWNDVAHLDYRNPGLRRYMTDMLVYWLREFDVDGFRCDAAGEVPTDFWEQAAARYEHNALHMRFSDNQDESRAVTRFGLPGSLAAAAFMLTMDGVPLLYNGMEVGDTSESGAPALFERIPIFWAVSELRPEVPVFYQQMIALRHSHPALTHGAVRWLRNSEEQRIVTFERAVSAERLVVAVNLSSQPYSGDLEVGSEEYEDITPRWQSGSAAACTAGGCRVALPALTLQAWEFRIFRRVERAR